MGNALQRSSSRKSGKDRSGLNRSRGIFAFVVCLLAALQGCTALISEQPGILERDGVAPSGVHYFLPKTVIDLILSVDPATASFRLTPGNVRSIADPRQRFYLRYRPLPHYEDKITVNLGSSGLLRSVIADTEDKTPGIILNLARAFGALGGGFEAATVQPNEAQLVKFTVDPADDVDLARVSAKFDKAARDYARAAAASVCKKDPDAQIILDVTKRAQCDEYVAVRDRRGNPFIAVRSLRLAEYEERYGSFRHGRRIERAAYTAAKPHPHSVEAPPVVPEADCSVGICYRSPEPLVLMFLVGKSATRSILLVPNKARVVEIDIRRTFFVNKVQTIEFDANDGTLSKMHVTKASELLALSALPVAVLNAVVEGIQLRVKLTNAKINDTTATRDLLAAQADLQKQKALLEAAIRTASNSGIVSQSRVPRQSSLAGTPAAGNPFVDRTPAIDDRE